MEQTNYERTIQTNSDFLNTFGSAHGVKTLEFLSNFCLEHECTFDRTSARKSDFNQGARAVILEIRHWLNMDISKLEKDEHE